MRQPSLQIWAVCIIFIVLLGQTAHSESILADDDTNVEDLSQLLNDGKSDQSEKKSDMVYNFDDIEPSGNLNWVLCYDNFTCANLEVPLDYENLAAGYTNLAFIKHAGSDRSAEDILINPGGPGGSGVNFVLKAYQKLRDVKPATGPTYNLIGFDPRGVGNSGPYLDCFANNTVTRDMHYVMPDAVSSLEPRSSSSDRLPVEFAETEAHAKFCSIVHKNGYAGYVGSSAVAQDMLHFIKLRAKQNGKSEADATLNFYGASYGTVIGSTFAALYPDRVRRMILDGVVDLDVWYGGIDYGTWTQTDACVEAFFDLCHVAGLRCAFNKGAKSRDEIKTRFEAVVKDIEAYPIAVFDPKLVSKPDTVEVKQVLDHIFYSLYVPVVRFPKLADIFEQLERRDPTKFINREKAWVQPPEKNNTSPKIPERTHGKVSKHGKKNKSGAHSEATLMVAAIDANGRYNVTNGTVWEEHKKMRGRPKWHRENFSQGPPFNRAFTVRAPKSQAFDPSKFAEPIKTPYPILFLTNTLDPITPWKKEMLGYFANSTVLTADAVGHCMTASNCSRPLTRRYLDTGKLPPDNIVCEVDKIPFLTQVEAHRHNSWFHEHDEDAPLIIGRRHFLELDDDFSWM